MLGNLRLRKSFTNSEKKIVNLMLEGDSELFFKLKAQLVPPFHRWIERRTSKTKPAIYRPPPNEYHIDLVYDGKLRSAFSAGEQFSLVINDLVIVEKSNPDILEVEGHVSEGILTNIVFKAKLPILWPNNLCAVDWWYKGEDGVKSKHRKEWMGILCPLLDQNNKPISTKLLDESVMTALNHDAGVSLRHPASKELISGLIARLKATLPSDFIEFLEYTNGAILWGTCVFGCSEVYELDEQVFGKGKVAFSETMDSSFYAFDLSGNNSGLSYPIIYYDHESHETRECAYSFEEWLEFIRRYEVENKE